MSTLLDSFSTLTLVNLLPSANIVVDTAGAAFDVRRARGMAYLLVTTDTGGGLNRTLNMQLEDSADGSTGWATFAAFPEVNSPATGAAVGLVFNIDSTRAFVRANALLANVGNWRIGCVMLARF